MADVTVNVTVPELVRGTHCYRSVILVTDAEGVVWALKPSDIDRPRLVPDGAGNAKTVIDLHGREVVVVDPPWAELVRQYDRAPEGTAAWV